MKEEDRKLWTNRIKDYRASGLTAVKWSEKNDVSVHKLRYYINKFNKEKKLESKQESKEPKWVSVVPEKPIVENKSESPLKVIIGNVAIEVTSGFDEGTFQSLIRILSKC